MPVHRRRFGFMFQDFALFPHLNVGQNVAFGLRMAGAPPAELQARVATMLELVNLSGYAQRNVDALSGGEQQRVALARTLAPAPRLLLLDEPLANLDRLLREELAEELRTILKRVGVATLFVTHDQQEAFALADRLLVLNQGRVEQEGTPSAVYEQPANGFVATFLGLNNLVAVAELDAATGRVTTALGVFALPPATVAAHLGRPTQLLIRPDAPARLWPLGAPDQASAAMPILAAQVVASAFRGQLTRLTVRPTADPASTLTFTLETRRLERPFAPGEAVAIAVELDKVLLIDA